MSRILSLERLSVNEHVSGALAIRQVEVKSKTNGGIFARYLLTDGKKDIIANKWEIENSQDIIKPNSVVEVEASTKLYNGSMNLTLDSILPGNAEDLCLFINCDEERVAKLYSYIVESVSEINDIGLNKLCLAMLKDLGDVLKVAPGALKMHHNTRGGLLEHTYEVVSYVRSIVSVDKRFNADLAIAGAILHDVGKMVAYKSEGVSVIMTDEGKLYDHIAIGFSMIQDLIYELKLEPTDNVKLISHIILSHHGKKEYGSPVLPKCPEALLVSFADDLSAKSDMVFSVLKEVNTDDKWTPKVYGIDSEVYIASGDNDNDEFSVSEK